MYKVGNPQPFQSQVTVPAQQMAAGPGKETRASVPCTRQAAELAWWWKDKDREKRVSVYFYNYYYSKHNHSKGEMVFSR